MITLEKKIESKVVKEAKKLGILTIKLTPQGETGYPDRMFFIEGGSPLLIEFKRKGCKPNPKQEYIINQLQERGYHVKWFDNAEEAIKALVGYSRRLGGAIT
jgi:hypothetical protein